MNETHGDPTTTSARSAGDQAGRPPTEEELRAAYEAEVKKLRVEHLLLEHVVTLINLGSRRTGQAPGTEDERDVGQVRLAIESIRALLPVVEQAAPQQAGPIREALSQLQLAFVRIGGQQPQPGGAQGASGSGGEPSAAPGGGQAAADEPAERKPGESAERKPGEPGPAQRSGRLWIPGQ
jgi:hypothetical protein